MVSKPVVIGELVSVYGNTPVKVAQINHDKVTDRTEMILDWGDNQTSKVWLHDEGSVWFRYAEAN